VATLLKMIDILFDRTFSWYSLITGATVVQGTPAVGSDRSTVEAPETSASSNDRRVRHAFERFKTIQPEGVETGHFSAGLNWTAGSRD
jgi:hypothetical protein